MRSDAETETLIPIIGGVFDVTHSLKADGFDASEDGTGRGTPIVPVAVAHTLVSNGDAHSGFRDEHGLPPIVIQERAISENPDNGPQGPGFREDGAAYTLEARHHVQAVAFAQNQRGEVRLSDISPQLTTGGGKPGEGYPAVAFDMRGRDGGSQLEDPHETANIRAASGGSSKSYVAETWAVRRLTPMECERLQGFPDTHTLIEYRGKPAADGPRYKAIGNSMAVNVMRWIGERISMVERIMEPVE